MKSKSQQSYGCFFSILLVLAAYYIAAYLYENTNLNNVFPGIGFLAVVVGCCIYLYRNRYKAPPKSFTAGEKNVNFNERTTLNYSHQSTQIRQPEDIGNISFERWRKTLSEYPLKPGDKVSLWIKPGTSTIKAYHSQSVNGLGYLGTFSHSGIVKKYPPSKVTLRGKVISADSNRVIISGDLLTRKKRNFNGPTYESFLVKIEKKSRPGIKIYPEFVMIDGYNGNTHVFLQTRDFDAIKKSADSSQSWKAFSDFFFLVNRNGECVSVRHCSEFENLSRMIRAWKMGYGFKMVYEGHGKSDSRRYRCETFKL